jgi:hypothetical protein
VSMRDVSAGAATELVVALPLSDLPPGASMSLKAFGTMVAVFNVGGQIFGGQQLPPPRRAAPPRPDLGHLSSISTARVLQWP